MRRDATVHREKTRERERERERERDGDARKGPFRDDDISTSKEIGLCPPWTSRLLACSCVYEGDRKNAVILKEPAAASLLSSRRSTIKRRQKVCQLLNEFEVDSPWQF